MQTGDLFLIKNDTIVARLMSTIKLYHRQYSDSAPGVLWVSFYVNREKVNFSTNVPCDKKNFNETKQCITSGDKEFKDKNLILDHICSRITNVFVKYRLKNKTLTRESFLRSYNRPNDYANIFDFIKDYQKKISVKMEMSTFQVHKSVIGKLKERHPELHFDDITHVAKKQLVN